MRVSKTVRVQEHPRSRGGAAAPKRKVLWKEVGLASRIMSGGAGEAPPPVCREETVLLGCLSHGDTINLAEARPPHTLRSLPCSALRGRLVSQDDAVKTDSGGHGRCWTGRGTRTQRRLRRLWTFWRRAQRASASNASSSVLLPAATTSHAASASDGVRVVGAVPMDGWDGDGAVILDAATLQQLVHRAPAFPLEDDL